MYFLKVVEEALKRGELSVDLLNAVVHHDSLGWRMTSARKAHIDEFGDEIKRGEDYYRRESGPEVVDVLRLSVRSMDKVLRVLFEWNNGGLAMAKLVLRERDDSIRAALDRLDEMQRNEKESPAPPG
ncbi:MAG TPA: hypothetical protein VEX14_09035 [Burkholderiaceae bacterium]|nr:hypothetical protein [Burkholderiaceae bacterium]